MQANTNEQKAISVNRNIHPPKIRLESTNTEYLKDEIQILKKELKEVKKEQKNTKKLYLSNKTEGADKLRLFKLKLDMEARKKEKSDLAQKINSLEKKLI